MRIIRITTITLAFFFILLLSGTLNISHAVFGEDLVGRNISMDMLTDVNGEPLKIKNRSVLHIYTNQCPSCIKDKHIFSSMDLKNRVDLIGLKWAKKSNPDNPGVYSRIALTNNTDFFVELGMKLVPVTLVVGKNGEILYSHLGKLEKSTVEDEIIPIINAK